MTHTAPPPARMRDARGNCVRIPALLGSLLLALLATLLGRHPALRATWCATAATPFADDGADDGAQEAGWGWDPNGVEIDWGPHLHATARWPRGCTTGGYWSPHTHTYADCDPRILYVIGPRPNRGLNPRPRATPTPCPDSARAPPLRRAPPAGTAATPRRYSPNPLCLSVSLWICFFYPLHAVRGSAS